MRASAAGKQLTHPPHTAAWPAINLAAAEAGDVVVLGDFNSGE